MDMKVNQRTLLSCAVSSVLGISATAALAQEGTSRTTSVLEEVVVTAQKRSESLQDVPVAVSAFTSAARDLIGITTIGDLTDLTPGLSYATTLDRMSLRGVGRLTNNYGSDPGIATYSDGFYTASNVEAGKRSIHTDRIEVLRGPQGTLYGRNSIGGALNVISKRPTETWEGEVRAVAGNYDTQIFDGSISGPITDWLRFKASGSSGGQGEGFFRDEDGGPSEGNVGDDLYAEGQLEFNIGDSFEGWFKYAHTEWNQRRRSLQQITPQDISPRYFGGLFPTTTYNGPQTASAALPNVTLATPAYTTTDPSLRGDHRLFNTDTPFETNLDNTHVYTLELIWHTGFADVKYVGGYQGYTYTQESDFDGTSREEPYTVLVGGGRNGAGPILPATAVHDLPAGPGVLSGGQGVLQQRDQPDLDARGAVPVDPRSVPVPRAGVSVRRRQRAESAAARCTARFRHVDRSPARPAESRPDPAERGRMARRRCARRVRSDRLRLQRPLEDDARRPLHRGPQGRGGIPHASALRLRYADHAGAAARAGESLRRALGRPAVRVLQRDRSAQSIGRRMARDHRHRRPRVDADR